MINYEVSDSHKIHELSHNYVVNSERVISQNATALSPSGEQRKQLSFV